MQELGTTLSSFIINEQRKLGQNATGTFTRLEMPLQATLIATLRRFEDT